MKIMTCLVLALMLFFAGSASSFAKPLVGKVGVILPLTGAAEVDGRTILQSLTLAQERLSQEGTANIRLIVEDDGTNPKNVLTAYQKLKEQNVSVIIGPAWSFLVRTIAPLAPRDKIVLFTTSNAPEVLDFNEAGGYLFSNSFTIENAARPLTAFLSSGSIKRAAFLRTDTIWGEQHKLAFQNVLEKLQVEVAADLTTPMVSNNDFRELLPSLAKRRVDLLIALLSRDDTETMIRRAKEINFSPKMFFGPHSLDAIANSRTKDLFEGACLSYPYEENRADKWFYAAYVKKFHEEPRIYSVSSYDSLFIIAKALELASSHNKSVKETLPQINFKGLAGEYSYSSESSFSAGRNNLICVQAGNFVVKY